MSANDSLKPMEQGSKFPKFVLVRFHGESLNADLLYFYGLLANCQRTKISGLRAGKLSDFTCINYILCIVFAIRELFLFANVFVYICNRTWL